MVGEWNSDDHFLLRSAREDPKANDELDYLNWAGADLNRRHTDFQSVALPTELPARWFDLPRPTPACDILADPVTADASGYRDFAVVFTQVARSGWGEIPSNSRIRTRHL